MDKNVDITQVVTNRYKRMLWIPEDAVSNGISAMDNMMTDGIKLSELPNLFIYPVTIDMDSTNQTGDILHKNLIAFNDYGILTDIQIENNFTFIKKSPNWRNIFSRLGNINGIVNEIDYPIFVPTDPILIHYFASKVREELFLTTCGPNSKPASHTLSNDEYKKTLVPPDTKKIKSITLSDVARSIESININ